MSMALPSFLRQPEILQEKNEHKHCVQANIDWSVHKTKDLW
jgi:hypothetical protein